MSFDWQTDETEGESGRQPEAIPQPSRWSRLLLVLLLIGSVLVLGWLIARQVKTGTQKMESDLLASYVVIENAAHHEDAEVFDNFISAREPAWASAWEKVVAEGAYQERAAFGLSWLPAADPRTTVTSITFNPQLDAAELVTEQAYSFDIGHGLTETIRLQQTAIFSLGPNRWLLSPPDEGFWGAERIITGTHLSLQFPECDQAMANRLLTDLDDILAALCADPLFDCPADYHLNVAFETDPATLSVNYKTLVYIAGSWSMRLPAPTLTGLPQDEAGYRALLRGYGVRLVNPVMRQINGIHAGAHIPFFDASLDWPLRTLGLRADPLSAADWLSLARQATPLSAGKELFMVNGTATPFTYAVTEFLIEELGVTPETIMQSFISGGIRTYEDWLVDLTGHRLSFVELEERWQTFVQTQADAT